MVASSSLALATASTPPPSSQAAASTPIPRSLQVGARIPACSTGLIQGLWEQVLEQLMATEPGVPARINRPLIDGSGDQSHPYLQTDALNHLSKAVEERGSALLINSCLRTPMQHSMLHEQKQPGFCGIMAAAPPANSNHNSGLAIDVEDVQGGCPFLERHGWHWIGPLDPLHYDSALSALIWASFRSGPSSSTGINRTPTNGSRRMAAGDPPRRPASTDPPPLDSSHPWLSAAE